VQFSRSRLEAALKVVQLCSPLPIDATRLAPQLLLFDLIDSTNRALWGVFDDNLPEGTIAIADQQSTGKGQWGHQWQSEPGGLYLSVALTPNCPIDQSSQLTLCTAWGIATALREIPSRLSGTSEQIPVRLKWLNDLVVRTKKLGGILTETRIQNHSIPKAVVGVGMNWINPVPEPGINLESILQEQSVPLIESLEMLAAITIAGLIGGYQYWQTFGIEAILPKYLDLLVNVGQTVTIGDQMGTVVGVLPSGELHINLCCFGKSKLDDPDFYAKPGTISLGYG
jgi:BirA family transcriptional regulator, biotin operon repressor / biotin---[acetyl-CoA-carboxylase] ligase